MGPSRDVRWQQRLQNFERALALLGAPLAGDLEALSDLEAEGVIQRFEYTVELAWKALKDFLEASGVQLAPVTPRETVKQAFAAGLVPDGQAWIDMLDLRNAMSHTYDESRFRSALPIIAARFLPALRAAALTLAAKREPLP